MSKRKAVHDRRRAQDERLLEALRLRQTGMTWPAIAQRLGYAHPTIVATACANVRKADTAESGETTEGAY